MSRNGINPGSPGITIPKNIVTGLIHYWNITPNVLGALVLPTANSINKDEKAITEWLNTRENNEIDWIKKIISWVSSPLEIANITVFSYDLLIDRVHAHVTRADSDTPVILQRDGALDIQFSWQPELDNVKEMIYQHLMGPGIIEWENISFKFSRPEAELFFACCDLMKGSYMKAMISHTNPRIDFLQQDLKDLLLEEKKEPDIRWLHPFLSAYLWERTADAEKNFESGLSGLQKQGLIEPAEAGVIRLSGSGTILAHALNYAPLRVGISNAVAIDSQPVIFSRMVLIRTAGQIWVVTENFDDPGSVIMTTIPGETMKGIVTEAFMLPSLSSQRSFCLSKNFISCPHCNAPLPSSAKFCRKCGNQVNPEAP